MKANRILAGLGLALLALPLTGSAGPTAEKWIPNSLVLPPFAGAAAGFTGGNAIAHITRRITPDPTVKGRFMLGHALYGLYSGAGAGWAPVAPHCINPARWLAPSVFQTAEDALHLLGGCGVEDVAFDPSDPLAMYATTYNLNLITTPGVHAKIAPGGVYRASIAKVGSMQPGTGGILWTNVLPGVRGNALAVRPTGTSNPLGGSPYLAVGRIQHWDGGAFGGPPDTGTDNNAACNSYTGLLPAGVAKCSPSVYMSYDGGSTWAPRYFDPGANPVCANGTTNISTSSRLVGNLAFDPTTSSVIYAGANSGLWVSTDSGINWSWKVQACGSSPGFAATTGGTPGTQRLYAGFNDGSIKTAQTGGASGPGTFTTLVPAGQIDGRILTVLLDKTDATQRTMFVAAWDSQPRPASSTRGGVYKVVDNGNGTASVTNITASLLDPLKPQLNSVANLLPYPLFFDHPLTKTTLFLAQHPLAPELLYASTVWGGVWTKHAFGAL